VRWLLIALIALPNAHAGKRRKKRAQQEEAPPPEPEVPAVPPFTGLFSPLELVPIDAAPEGLANLSAQGCAGCHADTTHQWATAAHAGPPSPGFTAALADRGNPTCGVCHWPIARQQPSSFTPDLAQPPASTPSDGFDATLHLEGVTCVACHVREGSVIAATPGPHAAPHPTRHGPELASGEVCRSCHQLDLGGVALYDVWGEWERSPYAAADVGCLDCHGRRGPDGRSVAGHRLVPEGHVAVSMLVDIDGIELVRGGEPLQVTITLQNTGAGHHWPSGGPWSGARVEAALVALDDDGQTVRHAAWSHDLRRRFDEAWAVVEDTRLPAATTQTLSWSPSLDQDAPAGPWRMEVGLWSTARGERVGEPHVLQTLPLVTD